jgi:hypothetical protein
MNFPASKQEDLQKFRTLMMVTSFTPADSSRQGHPVPSATTTCCPPTNSLHVFPGCFVAHAVFKVHPLTVRCSAVTFTKLRDTSLIEGVTPNTCLRHNWAASNLEGKKVVCPRCWSAFREERNLQDHQRHSQACLKIKQSQSSCHFNLSFILLFTQFPFDMPCSTGCLC